MTALPAKDAWHGAGALTEAAAVDVAVPDGSVARDLILVGGDLGSGKTSGISALLARHEYVRPHVLVNDAGMASAEFDMSELPDGSTRSLLGKGCACCDQNGALLEQLSELVEAPPTVRDAVLLEASGIADTAAIVRSVTEHPKLRHHLNIAQVVYYLDAGVHDEDLSSAQRHSLMIADVCVISKSDLVDRERFARLAERVRETNPLLGIFAQRMEAGVCVCVPVVDGGGRRPVDARPMGDSLGHARPQVVNLLLSPGISWLACATWLIAVLDEWGDRIMRAKFVIPRGDHAVIVHGVKHTVFPPQRVIVDKQDTAEPSLVLIGSDIDVAAVMRSLSVCLGVTAREHAEA